MRTSALGAVILAIVTALSSVSADQVAAATPAAAQTVLVSGTAANTAGTGDSTAPSVSADGQFIAFESAAALTSIPPAAGTRQVYLRDLSTDTTVMVSSVGGVSAEADATRPVISADGRFVAYISGSDLLGARGGVPQAIVWSRDTGMSRVVSLSSDPVPNRANAPVLEIDLSADGSTVVMTTRATNLTPVNTRGHSQVYSINLLSGQITLLSAERYAPAPIGGDLDSDSPAVSDDGQRVAFVTAADLVVAGKNQGHRQVYLYQHGGLDDGVQLMSYAVGTNVGVGRDAEAPDISGDAKVVAFVTAASDASDDASNGVPQVYVRDVQWSRTTLVTYAAVTADGADRASGAPVLSKSGDVVAFQSEATDLMPGKAAERSQIYRRHLSDGTLDVVSMSAAATPSDADSLAPSVDASGTLVAFQSKATNIVTPSTGSVQVYLRNAKEMPQVLRVGGADRFEVSARVSASSFAPYVEVAYVASGAAFADALAGSAAAGFQRAPVLLVTKDGIPAPVVAELRRLKPSRIVILGGTESVSEAAKTSLSEITANIVRVSGSDRFEVAAALSAIVFQPYPAGTGVAYIASGAVFPDALSGSAIAAVQGGPVLLATRELAPPPTIDELRRLHPQTIMVLGGPNTISEAVLSQLRELGAAVSRVGGADRFEVSANASHWVLKSAPGGTVYVASGETFPDALSGGPAAARRGAPILLVTSAVIPSSVVEELDRLVPRRIVVLGGTNTISQQTMDALKPYLAK